MTPQRTPLLLEYTPQAVGRGAVFPLPYFGVDLAATRSARKRADDQAIASLRRRKRLRELALEQWRQLVAALSD